ncbi:glycosyl transferase family protein [Mameliella alba]|uniref:glycosyl transferase family protein n=1 Tax=Mameliella alba TaxID=561184 RepID=UPI000B52E170|nr:glycosyl transferase family protein [Mameliella alba]MBY6117624.1 glycosyl transferase family protein [Mameliella alba]OWV44576.1 glycosyl transferase family 3 [Mameliella alba]OWV65013.1 glycosyl transferase family 3 [Mameliella alba]
MSLAAHVRTLGRGPGRARSLTRDEAAEAMSLMLEGAAPEAVGALLMLLRMKGETCEEIAGFARAAQAPLADWPCADLDWPCYAAGRSRGLPWFLLAARLVAASGQRVLLHGWNGPDQAIRDGLVALGIPQVRSPAQAARALKAGNIAYVPLEDAHPALFQLLDLRRTLGLRSCINTVCRMLNPGRASASVQGVFHPSYRLLQADAAQRLGWRNLTVIKGGGGEFERHPGMEIAGFGLREGAAWQGSFPALTGDHRRLSDLTLPAQALTVLWNSDEGPEFARQIVLGTAALAFATLDLAPDLSALWQARPVLQTA